MGAERCVLEKRLAKGCLSTASMIERGGTERNGTDGYDGFSISLSTPVNARPSRVFYAVNVV